MTIRSYAIKAGERQEPSLYYATIPSSLAAHLVKEKLFPAESYGKPWRGTDDKKITTVIDVRRYKSKKIEALCAHKTQQDDTNRFLNYPNNPLLRQEFFVLRMRGLHEVFMGKNDRVANKL